MFEYKVYKNEITITKYIGLDTEVTIPAEIDEKPVTTIGDRAFYYCRSLTAVVIPEDVTEIKYAAFENCPNLTIHAPKGSKAEEYARENNVPFEELKPEENRR